MGACVRVLHLMVTFVVSPLCVWGGRIVHSNSLTLGFITQGTDKRRKAEWFCFFSLFLSHFTLPFSLPAHFLSLTLESCGEEVKKVQRSGGSVVIALKLV